LAQGLGLGVLAVSSLDILAAGAREEAGPGRARTVVVVVDARRGEVFASQYHFDDSVAGVHPSVDPALAREAPPELLTPDGLAESLLEKDHGPGESLLIVGDGAVRYRQLLAGVPAADLGLAEHLSSPSPVTLARLAIHRLAAGAELSTAADLLPDYRREADARINWEQRIPPPGTPGHHRER
jgi:tRNA A37 threonylcarbamoyladenosine modification protein TsaB